MSPQRRDYHRGSQFLNFYHQGHRLNVEVCRPHHVPYREEVVMRTLFQDLMNSFQQHKLEIFIRFETVALQRSKIAVSNGEIGLLGDEQILYHASIHHKSCCHSIKDLLSALVGMVGEHFGIEFGTIQVQSCSGDELVAGFNDWYRKEKGE